MSLETVSDAREWIVKASLGALGAELLFFILAPALGYPLTFDESLRLSEIVTPVFLGYLGAAARFLIAPKHTRPKSPAMSGVLLRLLVQGPLVLWLVMMISALTSFYLTNRPGAASGGMSIDSLAMIATGSCSILAVTVSVLVSSAFVQGAEPHD
jgi:hypothetical protein